MLTGRWLCLGILFFNLAACTEGGHHNSSQVANASVSLVGDSSRSLGQVFTEPPKNIGNGDGFAPQPFIDGDGNAAVMVVAHHSRGLNIGALDLVTTSRITPLVLGGSELTANGFGYVQDPLTKRIYVPTDTNGQFTYSCINGDFRISLGETPSLCTSVKPNAGSPALVGSSLSADGLAIYADSIYGALGTSNYLIQLTCADRNNNNCNGYPITLATDYSANQANNVRFQVLGDNKIAVGFNGNNGLVSAVCFDLIAQASCGRVDSTTAAASSQPLGYFSGTTLTGFCAFSAAQMNAMTCKDFSGNLISGLQVNASNQNSPGYGLSTYMPGTGKYIVTSLSGTIQCLDMANGGISCGTTPNFTGTSAVPYGSAFYKNESTGDLCLLTYNDGSQLGIFRADPITGQLNEDLRCVAVGGVQTTWRVNDPVPQVCPNTNGTEWGNLVVTTGALTLDGAPVSATFGGDISVLDVTTGRQLARQSFGSTGSILTVNLTSLGVSYTNARNLDIKLRVLQSNGHEMRAGYQMNASLQVLVNCLR